MQEHEVQDGYRRTGDQEVTSSQQATSGLIDVNDDGRINIDVQPRLSRQFSALLLDQKKAPSGATPSPRPDAQSKEKSPVRLNIVIQVVGSRGDVQPFVALGTELQRQRGHRVRIATHATFEDFVRKAGLEFYAIGGDPAELMAYIVKNPGLIPSMESVKAGDVKRKRESIAEMLAGCWRSCIEPDQRSGAPFVAEAIIANPPSFAHVHCAQALGIPVHIMFTMPWTSTRSFPHPLANLKNSSGTDGKLANLISYAVVEWMTWQGIGGLVNMWRRQVLGLEPIPAGEGPLLAEKLIIPHTYCWSPAFVPKPSDWSSSIDVCGFFFRESETYFPPEDLAAFLKAGTQPIYIGFGSIVLDNAAAITETILEAVQMAGVRAIVSRGWSNLGEGRKSSDDVFWLGDCPHEWLFQHVSAVVHHGGAGTTACGLLNGKPTAIVPFFGDQPFWGQMIASADAGPAPIPHRSLTPGNLARAVTICLAPETSKAAQIIADRMRIESGVKTAAESFHRHLPQNMQCDLLSGHAASWIYKHGKKSVHLSKKAAAILSRNDRLTAGRLQKYSPKPFVVDSRRWDPVTAILSASLQTFTDLGSTAVDTVSGVQQTWKLRSEDREPASGQRTPDAASQRSAQMDDLSTQRSSQSSLVRSRERSVDSALPEFGETPAEVPSKQSPTMEEGISSTQESRPLHRRRKVGRAAAVSAKGLAKVVATPIKGIMVDVPLATAEGMRAITHSEKGSGPDRYGAITDWKSGSVVAFKNLGYGFSEGCTDIFVKTYKRKQQEGAKGVAKGLTEGMVDFTMKTGSGLVGLVAYPSQGVYRSLYAALHRSRQTVVEQAMTSEGDWLIASGNDGVLDRAAVCAKFDGLMSR